MRFLTQEVALFCNGLHASTRCRSPRHAQRSFHQTSIVSRRPRQRPFFTSNTLLAKDGSSSNGNHPPAAVVDSKSDKFDKSDKVEPASPKNKKRNFKATKNSLRDPFRRAVRKVAAPGTQPPDSDGSTLVCAVCAAESFDMDKVINILEEHVFQIDPEKTGFDIIDMVHARAAGSGDIFVFPSGTVVTWSMPPEKARWHTTNLFARAANDPYPDDRIEAEEMEYTTDVNATSSSMNEDVVVLGTWKEEKEGDRLDSTLAKTAFSAGLARSTKVAYLEESLMAYFDSTKNISTELAKGNNLRLSKSYILQKAGELLNLRAQLNHYSELTDTLPDIFWDQKSLEQYYNEVCRSLDVSIRIRTLNQKMDYAQEISTVLREMSSEKHSTRLEVIIIVLIAVEVLFELRRLFIEYLEYREKKKEAPPATAVVVV